jgi:hypothetical protein
MRNYLLLILSISFFTSYCQSTPAPVSTSYLISNSGDTLRGQIVPKKKKGAIRSIEFNNEKTFGPTGVREFSVNGAAYQGQIVSVDKSPKKDTKVIDTVFLEVLSRGEMNLLFYVDEFEKNHFFVARGSKVEELVLKIASQGDGVHFFYTAVYKDQLKSYFPKSVDLYGEIDKTPYTRKRMQSIFVKCYEREYGKESLTMIAKEEKVDVDFGIIAGLAFSKINFDGHYSDGSVPDIANINFKESITPSGGIFFDLKFPRSAHIFSLYNELQYKQLKTSGSFSERGLVNGTVGTVTTNAYINEQFLKYNLLFKFRTSRKENTPFFNLGLANSFVVANGDYKTFSNAPDGYKIDLTQDSKNFELGVLLGVGYLSRSFCFELRYERSPGINGEANITSKTNSFYTMVSYNFLNRKNKSK